ncbi:hypothetical protein B0H16DRAFT_1447063 [Mycena metata]|uniref:Uncharacterized protein n=1 Tax=Mycena metata TaxID=1033252 RepID=A0AAD7P0J6_9AGAR|nr:hypothetical protein B0H16DRAFT_1447063 [Mycena metata]
MAPKYLCCLPLRLGVLINSFLQFLASGAVCAFLVLLLVFNAEGKLRVNDAEVVLVPRLQEHCHRFIGAIRKKESYVGTYLNLLRLFLLIHFAVVVAFLILFFADKNEFKKLCLNNSTDPQRIDDCNKVMKSSVPAVIVAAILPLLFQTYGVHIVGAYTKKLRMRDSYAMVGEESRPLTHHAAYPFSDNSSKV